MLKNSLLSATKVVLLGLALTFSVAIAHDEPWEQTFERNLAKGDIETVKDLLNTHPDAVNEPFLNGETMLTYAFKFRLDLKTKKAIFKLPGIDLEATNELGETPIMVAAFFDEGEALETLIKKNPAAIDPKTDWSPLMYAATSGNINALKILIKHGAQINRQTPSGITALYMSAREGQEEAVRLLLKAGAKPDICTRDGVSPARIARIRGHEKLTNVLAISECKTTGPAKEANQIDGSSQKAPSR